MKVAVVKPDHLGDFVLSSPAIRALQGRFREVVLFVGGPVRPLAETLFPSLEVRSMDLVHLRKERGEAVSIEAARSMLTTFDHIFFLRDDPVMRAIGHDLGVPATFASGDHLTHETLIQQRALKPFVAYCRDELFPGTLRPWPLEPRNVGLCVSAGFPANRWPEFLWAALGSRLKAQGTNLFVVGGPTERDTVSVLSLVLGLPSRNAIIGGFNFATFLDAVSELDLVIATDAGTAHLCSLRTPILSIFGASPWRRYVPFGSHNRLVRRETACSPCAQFSMETVNACVSRECLLSISPDDLIKALQSHDSAHRMQHLEGTEIWYGTSHLDA